MRLARQPTPQPQVPQFRNMPDPDRTALRSGFEAFKSPAIFLALMGSLASRRPLMGAMQAATGVIEGFQQGDKERVERNRQIWKDEVEAATKQNDIEQRKFSDIMENTKLSMQDKIAQMNALFSANKDEVQLSNLTGGGIDKIAQLHADRVKAVERLKQAVATAEIYKKQTPDTTGQFTPGAINDAAERYVESGTFPPGLGRGVQGDMTKAKILNRVNEIATERGIDPATFPTRWQEFKGRQVSRVRFDTGPQGNTIRSLNVVIDHLNTIDDLSRALKNKDFQTFNQIANEVWKRFGGTPPTNITAANAIVGTEVIKALGVAGAGTMAERLESAGNWSTRNSPDQLLGATQTVKKLLSGQLLGLRQQFTSSNLGTEDDFNRKLFPKTIEELERSRDTPEHGGTGAPSSMSDADLKTKLGIK